MCHGTQADTPVWAAEAGRSQLNGNPGAAGWRKRPKHETRDHGLIKAYSARRIFVDRLKTFKTFLGKKCSR
jgi:hypothetical protein